MTMTRTITLTHFLDIAAYGVLTRDIRLANTAFIGSWLIRHFQELGRQRGLTIAHYAQEQHKITKNWVWEALEKKSTHRTSDCLPRDPQNDDYTQ